MDQTLGLFIRDGNKMMTGSKMQSSFMIDKIPPVFVNAVTLLIHEFAQVSL